VDLQPGYREFAPPAALCGSLACLWLRVAPATGDTGVRVLPDACSDLIWKSGQGAFVAGPDTSAWLSAPSSGSLLVGARFLPGAGGPALGMPLSELRDTRADLADVLPELDRRLGPELTPRVALARIVESAAGLTVDPAIARAVAILRDPRSRVQALADELGLGERQLRRRFHAAVGYSPKTLQRVLRFRRFLAQAEPGADLARIAFDAGFADQAHLTRESVRLAGLTPARLAGSA
jgi:AraC-like DNA-binding protein